MEMLILLMTICGLFAAAIVLVYAIWTRKNWLESFVLGGVVIWFAGYAVLLFANSIFSLGIVHPAGKQACEQMDWMATAALCLFAAFAVLVLFSQTANQNEDY
jgi:hypothetical protein